MKLLLKKDRLFGRVGEDAAWAGDRRIADVGILSNFKCISVCRLYCTQGGGGEGDAVAT